MDNIYIKHNIDWDTHLKHKYGYVFGNNKKLINRLCDSTEEHSELSKFTNIYSFEKTIAYKLGVKEIDKIFSLVGSNIDKIKKVEGRYNIELPLLRELNQYLVKSETKQSNEFIYNNGLSLLIRVLKEEFPLLGLKLVKEYTKEEIDSINNSSREQARKQVEEDYRQLLEVKEESRKPKPKITKQQRKDEYEWFKREYQRTIIEYGIETLSRLHRFYLELATGGGKSYIIYEILSKLKPETIVIFSPRKNINKQNSSSKYLSILGYEYLVYDCSVDRDFIEFKEKCNRESKKMIIVACSQSQSSDNGHKVYDIIHDNNLSNIFIWFDEAHNTVENWVDKLDNKYTKFFLENTDTITNRIFTSASPDKKHVSKYPEIFGELYSPIKVKELIALKWLCPIVPHIFSLNKNNVDICNYNIENFDKFNCKFGFSFHNLRDNACNLFLEHYKSFIEGNTKIKPFLLVGDDYVNSKLDDIRLEYNYRSIDLYEETENIIGYVVQQYSIGYDFKGIDYIIFSDPKMSYSDIIQCIGRGIRPDGLGTNGENLYKKLSIMLPVYIESDIDTDFNRIEGVLRYLVHDINYTFKKIDMNFSLSGNKKLLGETYDGNENMKAILLDLLRGGKYSTWKPKEFITLMKNNNIHDRENAYNAFIERRPELNLPEDPYRCFPDFTWENTYDSESSPYYSKEECKKKIAEIKENNEDLDLEEEDKPEVYLNSIDLKIPPQCLFRFYGGHNNNEYF
jgi:superfamily II DNA or RNA helicase